MLPQNDGNQSWYNLLNGTYKYYASEMQNGTGNITGGDTLKAIDNDKDSSRALRSLPLSVMLSGNYTWASGILGRGAVGFFWVSTPYSYTNSRHLYFSSTTVGPRNYHNKPYGFMLRCVARFPPKSPPLFHLNKFSELSSTFQILCAFPSRALRSLPLSVMMSGSLYWASGNLNNRGTGGSFWASTPGSYTDSRYLDFYSTNVYPKRNYYKPSGLTLRCVARFKISQKSHPCSTSIEFRRFAPRSKFLFPAYFLPELSAAFLFRL